MVVVVVLSVVEVASLVGVVRTDEVVEIAVASSVADIEG